MNPRATFTRSRRLAPALALAATLVVSAGWGAQAGGRDDHEQARQALEQGKVLPLRTVLDKVEREYQGQAIKIEFEREDGRFVYEIRLLQADGHVIKLEVDAVDGKVLAAKRRKR